MFLKPAFAGALALVLSVSPGPELKNSQAVKASDWFAGFSVPQPTPDKRGEATAVVFFVEQPTIDQLCGGVEHVVACAQVGGNAMAVPNPCQARFAGEAYAALLCHEKGHILGWKHED